MEIELLSCESRVASEDSLADIVRALDALRTQIEIGGQTDLSETACCRLCGFCAICQWCSYCSYCSH